MKHARIRYQGEVHNVTVEAGNAVRLADGTLLGEGQVEWLPPATGSMFALGLNYADHAAELAFKGPTEPLVFIKAPNTYTGHRQITWRTTGRSTGGCSTWVRSIAACSSS